MTVAISLAIAPEALTGQAAALDQVRSLRCETRTSVTTTWDRGVPAAGVAATPGMAPLTFDAIDRAAGRARLIGNAGATDVALMVGDNGLQFIERTGSGNVMMTTVYRAATTALPPGTFAFVHSRHFALMAPQPDRLIVAPSMHMGLCTVLQ